MTGLTVSILTSWAGILGVKRFGDNACRFLYLLFDKACNTMYFTRWWCFAVQLNHVSMILSLRYDGTKLSPFLSAADRIL